MKKKKSPQKSEFEKKLEAEVAAEQEAPEAPEVLEPVTDEDVESLMAERDDLRNQLLRARAEFDNFRKRTARETQRIRKLAAEGLLRDLLPVVDNLERALDHAHDASGGFAEGVEMVLKQLCDVLGQNGLTPIPAIGETFDPNVHEALMRVPTDAHPEDTVAMEVQKGYRVGDFVLRPSKVGVSAGSAEKEDNEEVEPAPEGEEAVNESQ